MLEMRKSVSKRAVFALANQRRFERRDHQYQPKHQADKQQDLPESAQVDVLITLAAEPEPHVAKALLNTHPFTGKRTADHKDQCAKQHIHAEPLILRFVPADCRPYVQACRQPRSSDPEDGELQMPRARHRVRQVAVEWEAIEAWPSTP